MNYETAIPENLRAFAEHTFSVKFPLWMMNFGANYEKVKEGKNILELQGYHKGVPAIVIGAGRSVFDLNHLNVIKRANPKCILIATDKMLKPCLKAGINPTYVTTVDGDPYVASYLAGKQVWKWSQKGGTGIFNVMSHPKTVETFKGHKYWFISLVDDPMAMNRSISAAMHFMTQSFTPKGITLIHTCGNVGGFSWNFAYFMGCNPIALIGMNYSYPADMPLEKTIYYDHWVKLCKGNMAEVQRCFRTDHNAFFKNESISDLIWDSYAYTLGAYIDKAKCTTINATGAGILHPPRIKKIKQMHFQNFLKKYA